MHHSLRLAFAAAAVGLMFSAAPSLADTLKFKAEFTGKAETPPNDSAGTGVADVTYDTAAKTIAWTITYSGLTGAATAAHFHGPAKEGAKAPPVVPIHGTLDSPINGTSTLSDQQAADLQNGLWYFNVHTAKYPDGEIRGQLQKQ
jgi:hypothetical protein